MQLAVDRRPDRPRHHYAALKQQMAALQDHQARTRYAEPLNAKLIVRIPRPALRELTAARRELRPTRARLVYRPRYVLITPSLSLNP